jgi:hypothetical protein
MNLVTKYLNNSLLVNYKNVYLAFYRHLKYLVLSFKATSSIVIKILSFGPTLDLNLSILITISLITLKIRKDTLNAYKRLSIHFYNLLIKSC